MKRTQETILVVAAFALCLGFLLGMVATLAI